MLKYKIFTMIGCDKCETAKAYLEEQGIEGSEVNISDDEGVVELRHIYPKLKDKVERDESGSLPVPLILFYENDEIIGVKHTQEEIEAFVKEKK